MTQPTQDALGNMTLLQREAAKDGSIKYLWGLPDEYRSVESIYFQLRGAPAACISTQVGCAVGCVFCETGKQKMLGNLTAHQIAHQIDAINRDLWSESPGHDGIETAVIAGMGEPLLNVDAVVGSADIMLDKGMARKVTTTTSGILPGFDRLKGSNISLLSVSLHATTDEMRTRLVPINKKYPIAELIRAATDLRVQGDLPIIMNYLLFDKVNDSDADIENLISLLDPALFSIKLKQWNTVDETGLQASPYDRFMQFEQALTAEGFDVSVDYSKGVDVGAGCGQLRSRMRELRRPRRTVEA